MSQLDSEFWDRATRARDQLVERFIRLPGVNLIDIGIDPERTSREARMPAEASPEGQQLVLRVHVDKLSDKARLGIPDEIDGIPVRVIVASYKPD